MPQRTISEQAESKIKQDAEKALADLSSADRTVAANARATLFDWLIHMDAACKSPASLVTDDHANTACNAFEEVLLVQPKGGKFDTLIEAWRGLTDEEQLNVQRFVIGKFIHTHVLTGMLLSRENDNFLWENTGFHIDEGVNAVFSKVGRLPYQPIGYLDKDHFVPNEVSKSLWVREWAIALTFPWKPAFVIERKDIGPQNDSDAVALSDAERRRIDEVLGWFDEDLALYSKTSLEDVKSRNELFGKMRESVKLAAVRVPRLQKKLDEFKDQNPEAGDNLEQVFVPQLISACAEFLRMKMEDDTVRRKMMSVDLAVKDDAQVSLLFSLRQSLLDVLPVRPENPVDAARVSARIDAVHMAFPVLQSGRIGTTAVDTAKMRVEDIDKLIPELKAKSTTVEGSAK